jgi:glutamyl-tRNA synthetase
MVQMIAEGKATGWDDPRLHTVRALIRRGFQPEALRRFATVCSISKTDIRVGWENLEGTNRKLIDPMANRYMVVRDPVKISIKGAPDIMEAKEDLHPDFPERGKKTIPVNAGEVYISGDDWRDFKGMVIRLKGLGNMTLDKSAQYEGNEIVQGMPKIQWVSVPHVEVEVLGREGNFSGVGEFLMKSLKKGDIIQMERIGFGKIDSNDGKRLVICFSHK